MKVLLAVFLFLNIFFAPAQTKINGLSFVASNNPISIEAIEPVLNINANWVAVMPFGFLRSEHDTEIIYNSKRQWWGETKIGAAKTIQAFQNQKIKVMLKPQIWIPNGGFSGNINMKSEADWIAFEKKYELFILDIAQLAADNNVAIFCVGTELHNFVLMRTSFWKLLLVKIKTIFKGKITYAENWDTFEKVPFLADLDFIGIDAYFPLSSEKSPSLKTLINAWNPIKKRIKQLSNRYNKPVLFTEFGYQSKDFATAKPWDHSTDEKINLELQSVGLQSFFMQFWAEKWCSGGFLWKWYDSNAAAGGLSNTDYTVQNKPAQELVSSQFKKVKKAQ